MNLFDLKNNPLFLQSFRERNRFSAVVSAITLVSILAIILFISAFLNDNYVYQYQNDGTSYTNNKVLLPWYKKVILDLSVMQGIIILLFYHYSRTFSPPQLKSFYLKYFLGKGLS